MMINCLRSEKVTEFSLTDEIFTKINHDNTIITSCKKVKNVKKIGKSEVRSLLLPNNASGYCSRSTSTTRERVTAEIYFHYAHAVSRAFLPFPCFFYPYLGVVRPSSWFHFWPPPLAAVLDVRVLMHARLAPGERADPLSNQEAPSECSCLSHTVSSETVRRQERFVVISCFPIGTRRQRMGASGSFAIATVGSSTPGGGRESAIAVTARSCLKAKW